MSLVMRLGAILAACLLWIDAGYGREGACIFEPCPTSCKEPPCEIFQDVPIKRTVVPRGIQTLIGRIQDQLGRISGSRLRRLHQSEFLGKRSEMAKRATKSAHPEFLGKRANTRKPSEMLGKRDVEDLWTAAMKRASELLGKRTTSWNQDFPLREERGQRSRYNSGRELLGKRSDFHDDATENLEFSTNEEIRDDD